MKRARGSSGSASRARCPRRSQTGRTGATPTAPPAIIAGVAPGRLARDDDLGRVPRTSPSCRSPAALRPSWRPAVLAATTALPPEGTTSRTTPTARRQQDLIVNLIVPRDATGKLLARTRLIADAHTERVLVPHLDVPRREQASARSTSRPEIRASGCWPPGRFSAELALDFGAGRSTARFTDQSAVAVAVHTGLPPCDRL
jgi:hypothetical protein